MASSTLPVSRMPSSVLKYSLLAAFGVLLVVVWITRDRFLLDAGSFLRQRYAPIPLLMLLHGIPGTLTLFLGVFQFSDKLRQRYLSVHRIMGWVYVVSAAIAAPTAVVISARLPIPTLLPASTIQASAWILATGTAIYCVRAGRIQQHREWMMRGYPFAVVFLVVRAVVAIPAVERMGLPGLAAAVWSVIAVAGILPSFLIEWQHLAANRRVQAARSAALASRPA